LNDKLELIHSEEIPWEPFGGQTKEIFRKSLSHKTFHSGFKATLTLAKPGGEFPEHVDPYHHIFFILQGQGEAFIEGQTIPLKGGDALTVAAGKKHGYRNASLNDLVLITLNIFEKREST